MLLLNKTVFKYKVALSVSVPRHFWDLFHNFGSSLSCACCLNVPNQTVDMSSQHTEFQCSFLAKLLGRISSFYKENYKDVINVNYFSFLLVRKG